MINNYEKQFIDDNIKTGRSSFFLGIPGSGKTYLALKFILYALNNNLYQSYHLVLPVYKSEQNNQYDFIRNYKDQTIYIYNKYDEIVSTMVLKEKGKTFFMIDDASAELLNNIDQTFIKLFTTLRHNNTTMFVCIHSAKKIITPMLRQNLGYLFLYKIQNSKLLRDIYDEWISIAYEREGKKYKEFMSEYGNLVFEGEHQCLLINNDMPLQFGISDWGLYNEQPKTNNSKETKRKITSKEKPKKSDLLNNNPHYKPFKK